MRNFTHGKISWALVLFLGGLLFSPSAFAMNHQSTNVGKPMEGAMPEMGRGMIMVGHQVRSGVEAMTHLLPLGDKSDSSATHHLMVKFTDVNTHKTLIEGDVRVRVIAPDDPAATTHGEPRITQYVVTLPLDIPEGEAGTRPAPMKMKGHFGTDVTLDQPGIWHLEIVAELADGQVRTYDAHYQVK